MFLFVTELWWIRTFFFLYQSMWEDTKSKSFVRFSLFHLLLNSSLKCETLKKKERKKRLVPLQIRSPLHCWTTFFFCVCFYTTDSHQNISELNSGMLTQFDHLCAHLSKRRHHTTTCFTFVRLFTLSSTLIGQRFTIRQTRPQKNPRLVCMKKLFTEHVGPLFITTRDHFITSSTVTSGEEGTGFLFLFFCFFFLYVLTPYSFSGTSIKKRSCTYLWRGEEFLKTKDNWFVVNFFSPHIGENVFVGGGGGRWRRRRRAGLWGSICTCYCLYFK